MNNLYQPIKFKRSKLSNWEKGFKRIDDAGVFFLEDDMTTIVYKV
jgi:hypothetical protein